MKSFGQRMSKLLIHLSLEILFALGSTTSLGCICFSHLQREMGVTKFKQDLGKFPNTNGDVLKEVKMLRYKCVYCEEIYTDDGICKSCKGLKEVVKGRENIFFNILGVLADELGGELYVHTEKGFLDHWPF